jgi:PilZ domain
LFKLLAHFDRMVETRIAVRHRVLKAATIEFGGGGAVDCVVRDLSITGAALEVSSQIGIPAKFTLVIPGDALHLPCAVVWRSQYRIGVHFD